MYALNFYDLYHGDHFIGSDRFSTYAAALEAAKMFTSQMVVVKVISI